MFRWYIIRTLIFKEVLRYRYNWGLLVVVVALLALTGLVAVSSKFSKLLPGQTGGPLEKCIIYYTNDRPLGQQWVEHLGKQEPGKKEPPCALEFHGAPTGTMFPNRAGPGELIIALRAPEGPQDYSASPRFPAEGWKIRYFCGEEPPPGTMAVRDWLEGATASFLRRAPGVTVSTEQGTILPGMEKAEMMSIIVTGFSIFALYLLSFNLFITSTGEEREKKVLLGLLLSPARPEEMLAAKALFYASSSLVVSLAVVGMYDPTLLLRPTLCITVICGSLAYVAIGTVVLSIVRRQTTINTLSMLYLMGMSIIMILGQFLLPFQILQRFMVENYLYGLMRQIIAGQQKWTQAELVFNVVILAVLTILWCIGAGIIFRRHATQIARAR